MMARVTSILHVCLLLLLLLLSAVVYGSVVRDETAHNNAAGSSEPGSTCLVNQLRTQENFDLDRFMGRWYITSDIGLFPGHHLFDHLWYVAQDFKVYYTSLPEGQFQVYAGGRMAGICHSRKTHGELDPEGDQPSKLVTYFPASIMLSAEKVAQKYWVAYTDYDVALIYSCRGVSRDGTCLPSETYAWTLNRDSSGTTTAEQDQAVRQTMQRYCLNPEDFIEMPRTRPCAEINPDF